MLICTYSGCSNNEPLNLSTKCLPHPHLEFEFRNKIWLSFGLFATWNLLIKTTSFCCPVCRTRPAWFSNLGCFPVSILPSQPILANTKSGLGLGVCQKPDSIFCQRELVHKYCYMLKHALHLFTGSIWLLDSPPLGTPATSLTNDPAAENNVAFVIAGNHRRWNLLKS